MTAQEIVLARYPNAHSQYNKPVVGADLPHDRDGHWAIYQFPELGTKLLGMGASEEQAWADAAAKVEASRQGKGDNIRIGRETLTAALNDSGLGSVEVLGAIRDTAAHAEPVFVNEPDGSQSLLRLGEKDKFITTPIGKK